MTVGGCRTDGAVAATATVAAVIVRVRMIGRVGRREVMVMMVVVSGGCGGGSSGCHGHRRMAGVVMRRRRGRVGRRRVAGANGIGRRIESGRSATKGSSTTAYTTIGHVMSVVIRRVMVQRPCRTAGAVAGQSNADG